MKRFITFIFLLVFAPLAHADRLGGLKSGADVLLSTQNSAVTISSVSVSYLGKSSSTITELSKSSASVSYLGISSSAGSGFTNPSTGTVTLPFLLQASTMTASSSTVVSETVTSTFTALNISTWTFNGTNVDLNNGAGLYFNENIFSLTFTTYTPIGNYTLTATSNTINIGTSSMTITLTSSGTYSCSASHSILYSGATEVSNQFITSEVFRQNNTPGIVASSLLQPQTGAISGFTGSFRSTTDQFDYVTANINDVLSFQISISQTPSVGSILAKEAKLRCQRVGP